MTVLLLVEQCQLTLLIGQEDDLVIDNRVHIGDMVYLAHQVNGHHGIVHCHIDVRTQHTGQSDGIDIQQTVDLALAGAHVNGFAVHLEVGHREMGIAEVQGKEAVGILAGLLHVQELGTLDAAIVQLVGHLADLDQEVAPLAIVIAQQRTFLAFLRDDQIRASLNIGTAIEEAEIGIGEELAAVADLQGATVEALPHKHVLLM